MQTRKYLITNNSEGSICVTGRMRIDIPGMCRDLPLSLPENTARQTISRLKQRYPLLKIREVQENLPGNNSKAGPDSGNNAHSDTSGATGDKGNNGSVSDKNQNPASTATASDKGQTASTTSATASTTADDKNGSQADSSQNQTPAQKTDTKKGK